ncbi:probable disease resistance protein At4g27220 isoform X1 [Fagus crenata]
MLEAVASAAASAAIVETYKDGRVLCSNMKQKIDYANDLENNYKRLIEKAAKLYARREDIVIEADKYKTKQLTKECDLWISRVTNGEEDVRELTTKYENEQSKKAKWRRHSKRAKLSKSMVEKCEELHSLWLEGKFERGIMVEKLPERVRTLHAAKIEDKPSLYKDRSEEKLQRAITDRLKMNMEGITNPDEIAWRISKELECKKYLLLLDEVWNILDLPKLGIQDNQQDSKVVLATRFPKICCDMKTELINMKQMSGADAWKMFTEKVGQNVNLPSIEPIAKLVVRECAGFPLLIDKVASTFSQKKDNSFLWNYGLTSLRRWDSFKVQGMDELIEFLKFCYEGFICDANKFSDAHGEGHKILQFRDARNEGHKMLLDLINVSLLEESERMNHVRMNKVLRNMALKISSKSKTFKVLVKTREGLQEPPNAVEWQQRCFKFANGEGVNPVISEVLAETDAFGLIGHKGASRLSDFGIENINRMRVCLIEGCDEIETIVQGNCVDRSALEWLEKMCISNAQKLESIWEGPVHAGSLTRLTSLTLQRCPKLKKIFSNGMIEQLFKLEHLSVEECPEIEEIITNSENTGLEPEALPKLRTLVLSGLLKVESICTDDSLKWPTLERITISRCQLLTRLPLNKENAPYLRCIEGDQLWWTALEWKEDAIKGRFESFFKSN